MCNDIINCSFYQDPKARDNKACALLELWYTFTIPENYIFKQISPGTVVCGILYYYKKLCGPGKKYGEYI